MAADSDSVPGLAVPAAADRDRDPTGRPRNARPRDHLGRPLDRAAPGDPSQLSAGSPLADALPLAQQLIDGGRPFHAHEVLEDAWKAAPDAQRALWKGLAQLAVGLTHAMRGNAKGAVALLRRGADAVGTSLQPIPGLADVTVISRSAADLADRIERAGLGAMSEADLRLTITGRPGAPS